MAKMFLTLCLFVGSSAFATIKEYDLKMDLFMNGKKVSSPRIAVRPGEVGNIIQESDNEKNFIDVIATEGSYQNHHGILLDMIIGAIDKAGKRTILAKPRILTNENEPAQISVGEENGKKNLSLTVVTQRKTL